LRHSLSPEKPCLFNLQYIFFATQRYDTIPQNKNQDFSNCSKKNLNKTVAQPLSFNISPLLSKIEKINQITR